MSEKHQHMWATKWQYIVDGRIVSERAECCICGLGRTEAPIRVTIGESISDGAEFWHRTVTPPGVS